MAHKSKKFRKKQHLRQNHIEKPVFEHLEPRLLLNADMQGLLVELQPIDPLVSETSTESVEVDINIESSTLAANVITYTPQSVPYTQNFDSGLPTNVQGWEYYSDNNGRIQVVGGRLRMDDSIGDSIYSLNEAILHLNLTGQTNVNLSLDHYSIYDENHNTMPANFSGHYKADGIAVSIDGLNWIKVSDLTASSTISIDLNLISLFGASADLSDVRIKFQQYDNYPSPTDDGREFDNIQITPVSSGIVVQSVPYSQNFNSGLPGAPNGWEYYSDNDGRIQIVGGRLRMDDSVGDGTYSLNEAILHVDLTSQTNVNLSLDHYSIFDENHNTMPTNFTGHYKADGIAVSIDGLNWIKVSDLTGSSHISLDLNLVNLFGGSADLSDVRIKFQQYDNYPSTTSDDGREFDNIQITSSLVVQSIPYSQDFSSGLPDASSGWEYYSDNDGRIQVVGGRLRMDDSVGDGTYSLNEAILHLDLTGQTEVNLSFDHYSIYDENHNTMPTNFTGHYKADGIAVSIDGLNWIKVSDLTASSHISVDLDLVSLFGASADLSDVRIKFQQYDNYPSPTDDGREFDNIQVSENIVFDLNTWTENLMADDTAGGGFVINSATSAETISGGLTRAVLFSGTNDVGYTLEGQVRVTTTWDDDFIGFVVGYNNNDHVSSSADYILIDWRQADNDFDFGAGTVTAHEGLALSTVSGATAGEIQGNTYAWEHSGPITEQLRGNTLGTTGWNDNQTYDFKLVYLPGSVQLFINGTLELDYNGTFSDGSIGLYQFSQRQVLFSNLSLSAVQTVPYSQDFSSGLPDASGGWEYYSDNNGRIQVVGGRLRMDDSVGDGIYSLNEAILHVNLTGKTNVNLSLDHYSIYDENHIMPANFAGHANGDGIAISIDGTNWTKIYDLAGSSSISLDLDLVSLFGASADLSDVRIKFQQYDNYPSPTDDGREFDNIQITSSLVVQSIPYSQNFSSTLPDTSAGWEYYSDNDGRIQVVGGRLRMDDSVGDGTYSLNEAILHVDLTGQTNVNLSLDHFSIFDENHNTMPANFTGHYKADGIAISIDGLNWIKVSDLTVSSHISLNLDLVSLFGGSADLSNVRIKFQQYDNYPSTTSDDGREFDNIQITPISLGIVVQSVPYSQDFSSTLPDASSGWEYYSDNNGRIQVVGGRLRMDDSVGDSTYSLNEAILHLNLTGKTNVNLSLDHFSIFDENHNTMPASFTGHYKADGIAVSIDGLNWIKVSDLTTSSHISLNLDLVSLFGGSADLSDVRIKFQQYDNYPSTTSDDGREFDNISVTVIS